MYEIKVHSANDIPIFSMFPLRSNCASTHDDNSHKNSWTKKNWYVIPLIAERILLFSNRSDLACMESHRIHNTTGLTLYPNTMARLPACARIASDIEIAVRRRMLPTPFCIPRGPFRILRSQKAGKQGTKRRTGPRSYKPSSICSCSRIYERASLLLKSSQTRGPPSSLLIQRA